MPEVTERAFSARLDCHYLLRAPDVVDPQTPLVVTLHGFGARPEAMLFLTERLFPTQPVIASVQGPFQFFRDVASREVGYGWITGHHPAESIRLHRDMVSHVLEEVGAEFGIPPARRLLVGFSQSVSMNYRFAATRPDAVHGVIAICGGIPSDWDAGHTSQSVWPFCTLRGERTNTTHPELPNSISSGCESALQTSSITWSRGAIRCRPAAT